MPEEQEPSPVVAPARAARPTSAVAPAAATTPAPAAATATTPAPVAGAPAPVLPFGNAQVPAPTQAPAAGGNLEFLRNHPVFLQIRQAVQQNPQVTRSSI